MRHLMLLALLMLPVRALGADVSVEVTVSNYFNIQIVGPIEAGDEVKFQQAMLRQIRSGKTPGVVTIFSPGGAVPAALHIGRQIRAARMGTVGPIADKDYGPATALCNGRQLGEDGRYLSADHRAEFSWSKNLPTKSRWKLGGFKEDSRCTCTSACFLIWAGGLTRRQGVIGVHRPYFDRQQYAKLSIEEAQQQYGHMIEGVKAYLNEMDVPEAVVRKMMASTSEEMAQLTDSELEALWNGQNEALEELRIAKCGGWRAFKEFSKEWDKLVKSGSSCNKACQEKLAAFDKQETERSKCWEAVVDVKGEQEGIASYLQTYGP